MASMPLKIGSQNKKPAVKGCKKSASGQIVIPDYVCTITDGSFRGCNGVTSIVIPEGVKCIEPNAFDGCMSLESIEVSSENKVYMSNDGVLYGAQTIDEWGVPISQYLMFCPPRKQTVIVEPNTKFIRGMPFQDCTMLQSVTLPPVLFVPDNLFDDCTNLQSADLSQVNIPLPIERLFRHNHHLQNVTFSETQDVLVQNGLVMSADAQRLMLIMEDITDVTIPNTISQIADTVYPHLDKCRSVAIAPDSPYLVIKDRVLYNKDETALLWCPPDTQYIRLPDTVSSLPIERLHKCECLHGIEISPNNKTYSSVNGAVYTKNMYRALLIPYHLSKMTLPPMFYSKAFEHCHYIGSIETVDTPNHKVIDGVLYYHYEDDDVMDMIVCDSAQQSITLPQNVTMISEGGRLPGAFAMAQSLEHIEVERGNPIFFSKDGILYARGEQVTLVFCPPNKTDVEIPRFVRILGNQAFYRSRIRSLTIPRGVTTIGHKCFAGCTNLENIILPQTIAAVGNQTFADCPKLASLSLPCHAIDYSDTSFGNAALINENKNSVKHPADDWDWILN